MEEAAKEVWDSVTRMDTVKLILTANAISLQTKSTHGKVMGLKEALDEARKELMEVKNDLREVKSVVHPPKFQPPSSGGGDGGGSGNEGGDGSGGEGEDDSGSDGNSWD